MKKATKIMIASLLLITMAAITGRNDGEVEEASDAGNAFDPTEPIDDLR